MYGKHVTLDLQDCDPATLVDMDGIHAFLTEAVEKCGMHQLIPPYVVKYQHPTDKDKDGLTGFVVISESHISFHGYTNYRYAFLDVFSCNTFDETVILDLINKYFHPSKINMQVAPRGENFAQS